MSKQVRQFTRKWLLTASWPLQPPSCWPQVHRGKKFKAQLSVHDLCLGNGCTLWGHFPHCLKVVVIQTKSGHAMLLQWCSKLLKVSWAQSVCVFVGCNLQPRVECELPHLCIDQRWGCSWHLLTQPLRNGHNNVPFRGQKMSNCEEQLQQKGEGEGQKRQERLMDKTRKKKIQDKVEKSQWQKCLSLHLLTAVQPDLRRD